MTLISDKSVSWPDGEIDRQVPVQDGDTGAYALQVWNTKTIVDLSPTQDAQVNLTIDAELRDGSELILNINQDAVGRAVSFDSNIEGDNLAGAANDRDTVYLVYNKDAGTFRIVSNHKTVDA